MFQLLSVVVVALLLCARPSAAESRSYDLQNGASLRIRNQVVRLYGIYIPHNVAAALGFQIQGFVTCQETGTTYSDGSIGAVCRRNRGRFNAGEDLGAYLISAGLALAGPEAPFEYQALERIAQTTHQGIWGFQADNFVFRSNRFCFR